MEVRYPNSMQKQLIAKRVGITRDQVKVCHLNIRIAHSIDNMFFFTILCFSVLFSTVTKILNLKFQIWFQNRRRKDVVKPKSHSEQVDSGPSMVPDNVKKAVVMELLRHEVDPKGKNKKGSKPYQVTVAQRRAAAKQRSPSNLSTVVSPTTATTTTSPECVLGNASASFSSSGSPQSDQNNSRDSHNGVLNVSGNSSQGFNPMTPTSDCSSESGPMHNGTSPKDNISDRSQDSIQQYSVSTESISPCSSVRSVTTQGATCSTANENPVYIPTSHGLDMAGPPNAVAAPSLTPRAMQELREKIKRENEPPKMDIPPNKVAPASEPIPAMPLEGVPLSEPLTVHIPNSMLSGKTSPISTHSNSYSSPPSAVHGWQQSSRPTSDEYTQYSRDNPLMMRAGPNLGTTTESFSGQFQGYDPKVLPFPLVADSPVMLSSMPTYSESYQSGLRSGSHGAPGPYGRDPYHPLMISSFQNPYYNQDGNGHWVRPYSQPY